MRLSAGIAAALAAGLLGCTPEVPEGAPPGEGPRPRTRLDGVFAGGASLVSGTLQIDLAADLRALAAEGPVEALAAVVIIGKPPLRLVGTLDQATRVVELTGEGFTLSGDLDGDEVLGTFVWREYEDGVPDEGVFATLSEQLHPALYCGTYLGPGSERGIWHMLVGDGGLVRGVFSSFWGPSAAIRGSDVEGTLVVGFEGGGSGLGTIQDDRLSGSWTLGDVEGTFEGRTDGCPELP